MRQYKVYRWATEDRAIKFTVSDDPAVGGKCDPRCPTVAEFPITQKYDEDTQRRHAKMFCDYMNKIVEATEQAYQDNALLDRLKQ